MAEAAFTPESNPTLRRPLLYLLRGYITITLPFLLALICIRFVMTPLYLQLEYNRPDFPEDYYGFTTEDRLNYAPFAIQYLLNGDDVDFLGNLQFPDGRSMFNARELHHMRDVKIVTQYAYLLATVGGIAAVLAAIFLYRSEPARLRQALFSGALLTLGIIAAIIVIAIVNWDVFFTSFHTVFFASGTWRFEYSDTLIRLFPEQFWFDAALIIGGLSVVAAALILVICWRWQIVTSDIHK